MNIALWIVQILLLGMYSMAGIMKNLPDRKSQGVHDLDTGPL